MKIAVLGGGQVGGTLGERWADAGHEVKYGGRAEGSMEEAARFGEVAALATPWEAAEGVVKRVAPHLVGKPVLDCTNPIAPRLAGLTTGGGASGGELVAGWAPTAKVVKIFNTTGFGNMRDPDYGGQAASMFYCGDDEEAKRIAHTLAAVLGFDAIDAGALSQARYLEPMAMLWITMSIGGHGRDMAFKLLKR